MLTSSVQAAPLFIDSSQSYVDAYVPSIEQIEPGMWAVGWTQQRYGLSGSFELTDVGGGAVTRTLALSNVNLQTDIPAYTDLRLPPQLFYNTEWGDVRDELPLGYWDGEGPWMICYCVEEAGPQMDSATGTFDGTTLALDGIYGTNYWNLWLLVTDDQSAAPIGGPPPDFRYRIVAFAPAAVPEPRTLPLLAVALLAAVCGSRSTRR